MAEDRATRIGGALGRKIGPLPAGVWLGFVAVGAYLYQHRKGAQAQTPSTVPPPASSYYQTIGGSSSTYNVYPPRAPGSSSTVGRGGGTGGHARGPLPPQPVPPPIDTQPPQRVPPYGPERPGGGDYAIELPIVGAIAIPRLPAVGLGVIRANAGGDEPQVKTGQRMAATRPTLRAPLAAAQRATENAPGLVGLAALEEPAPERDRSAMPPTVALRQRPAPPRVMHEQRNVKTEAIRG